MCQCPPIVLQALFAAIIHWAGTVATQLWSALVGGKEALHYLSLTIAESFLRPHGLERYMRLGQCPPLPPPPFLLRCARNSKASFSIRQLTLMPIDWHCLVLVHMV